MKKKILFHALLNDNCLHQLWLYHSGFYTDSYFCFPFLHPVMEKPALSISHTLPCCLLLAQQHSQAPLLWRPRQTHSAHQRPPRKNQFWPTFPYAECPASKYCSSFVHHMQKSSWKHLTFVNSVTLYEIPLTLCMVFRFPNWKCIKAKPVPPLVKGCTRKILSKLKTSDRLSAQTQQAHTWMDATEQKCVSVVSSASSHTQKGTFNTALVNGKTPGHAASPGSALPPGSHRQSKRKQRTTPV